MQDLAQSTQACTTWHTSTPTAFSRLSAAARAALALRASVELHWTPGQVMHENAWTSHIKREVKNAKETLRNADLVSCALAAGAGWSFPHNSCERDVAMASLLLLAAALSGVVGGKGQGEDSACSIALGPLAAALPQARPARKSRSSRTLSLSRGASSLRWLRRPPLPTPAGSAAGSCAPACRF